ATYPGRAVPRTRTGTPTRRLPVPTSRPTGSTPTGRRVIETYGSPQAAFSLACVAGPRARRPRGRAAARPLPGAVAVRRGGLVGLAVRRPRHAPLRARRRPVRRRVAGCRQ